MPISKITFKRNYSINLILHEHVHLGLEYDLNEGENAMDALISCDQFVKEGVERLFGKDKVAGISVVADNYSIPDYQVEKDKTDYTYVIEQINVCETLDELKSWQTISLGNTEAIQAYTQKLKQLQ